MDLNVDVPGFAKTILQSKNVYPAGAFIVKIVNAGLSKFKP